MKSGDLLACCMMTMLMMLDSHGVGLQNITFENDCEDFFENLLTLVSEKALRNATVI